MNKVTNLRYALLVLVISGTPLSTASAPSSNDQQCPKAKPGDPDPVYTEAISRAHTIVSTAGSEPVYNEAISRSYTIMNRAGHDPIYTEAHSRAITVCNGLDIDSDEDGLFDCEDNCPDHANPRQEDCDKDGIGDACAALFGLGHDENDNGVPDECEPCIFQIADLSGDGMGNLLDEPKAIAVDQDNRVYVGSWGSDNVLRISDQQIDQIIDAAGDGQGNILKDPFAIATDAKGNVYVGGFDTHNVFKITPGGVITEIIDESDGLMLVRDIEVADSGNIYVVGQEPETVFRITPGGQITQLLSASLSRTSCVAVAPDETLYVVGGTTDAAIMIAPDGTNSDFIIDDSDGLDGPNGCTLDNEGNFYVTGSFSHNAFKISPDLEIHEILNQELINQQLGAGVSIQHPYSISVDDNGIVYVSCEISNNVFSLTPQGLISEVIDQTGDGTNALMGSRAMVSRPNGQVYVAGLDSDNVFSICPGGIPISTGFCLFGVSDEVPWSFGFNDIDPPVIIQSLDAGADPSTFAQAFVENINGELPLSGIFAQVATLNSACFEVSTWNEDFEFWVGPVGIVNCQVTDNPAGCAFNPLILEVSEIPAPIPATSTIATIITTMALTAGGALLLKRRASELRAQAGQ